VPLIDLAPSEKLRNREMAAQCDIIAIDPGRLSGVVRGRASGGKLKIEYFQEIEFTPNTLYRFLIHQNIDVLIVERFSYRPKHRAEDKLDLFPCFLIGICILWQEQNPAKKMIMQEASQAKGGYYGRDDTISELGVYYKGGKGHARDATRHLLYWFYDGAGFQHNESGVVNLGMHADAPARKPVTRKPRNDGEIKF
jgi:hypothetical protein